MVTLVTFVVLINIVQISLNNEISFSGDEPEIVLGEKVEEYYSKIVSSEESGQLSALSRENAWNEVNTTGPTNLKKPATLVKNQPPIDVSRLDIRVGKILHAQVHPDADGLYIEQIEVGEEISRTVVSRLVKHVSLADLDYRMVVVLCNLKPKTVRGIVSEAMILCASTPEAVELLIPPSNAVAGDNITVPGYPRNPDLPFMNPRKKIFEKVAMDLRVNDNKLATYKEIPWEVESKGGFITVQAMSGCHIR